MQWLTEFQASLREPVFGFLGRFWPVLLVLGAAAVGYFFFDARRRDGAFDGDADLAGHDGADGGGDGSGD